MTLRDSWAGKGAGATTAPAAELPERPRPRSPTTQKRLHSRRTATALRPEHFGRLREQGLPATDADVLVRDAQLLALFNEGLATGEADAAPLAKFMVNEVRSRLSDSSGLSGSNIAVLVGLVEDARPRRESPGRCWTS